MDFDCPQFEVINRFVDVDGTKKMIRGVWLTTIFLLFISFKNILEFM